MGHRQIRQFFDSYCYGSVDLIQLCKGDSTMWLSLKDSAGKCSKAIYHNCVYWRLGSDQIGIHISLVQRVSAEELLKDKDSVTLRELKKNACNVSKLLYDWENSGLSFYMHIGKQPGQEFLVVAKSLEYKEAH